MKILIDNHPVESGLPEAKDFSEFCARIMEILLADNLSIGSCEFDGIPVVNLEEAHDLFSRCEICRIASVPLASALEAALNQQCQKARQLEGECETLVTEALVGEPAEVAISWQLICEEIKLQVGFLPRLSGLLTDAQVTHIIDRQLAELGKVMWELHAAFNRGDTMGISDSIELRLLPWLRQSRAFLESCRQLVSTLHD